MNKRDCEQIIFHEYAGFKRSGGTYSQNLSDLGLTSDSVNLLRGISESLIPGKRIFDIDASTIRARSFVGVLNIGDKQVEIHPKLLARDESNTLGILRNLMFMLSYTHQLDVEDAGIANLSKDFGSFSEAYISIFAERLNRSLARSGTPKRYEAFSENLKTVRGKINFSRNSIHNSIDRAKVFCDYSEFSEDNPISRAFKYVSVGLEKLTRNSATQRKLQRCIGLLEGVQPVFVEPDSLERASSGRRDANFFALIQLTKMFLARLRPQFGKLNRNSVFAILFDMNELFEQFIFETLKRHASVLKIAVKAQSKKRLVTAERDFLGDGVWRARSLFDTYTDIEVTALDSGKRIILDTKYKLIGDGAHYGVGNADVYQILAYKQIHSDGSETPNVGLLYPRHQVNFSKEFQVSGHGPTFFVTTLNVSDDLASNMSGLVREMDIFLRSALSSRCETG